MDTYPGGSTPGEREDQVLGPRRQRIVDGRALLKRRRGVTVVVVLDLVVGLAGSCRRVLEPHRWSGSAKERWRRLERRWRCRRWLGVDEDGVE